MILSVWPYQKMLTFAEADGTKTVSAILRLLLSVLLVSIEPYLRPELLDKMGRGISLFVGLGNLESISPLAVRVQFL